MTYILFVAFKCVHVCKMIIFTHPNHTDRITWQSDIYYCLLLLTHMHTQRVYTNLATGLHHCKYNATERFPNWTALFTHYINWLICYGEWRFVPKQLKISKIWMQREYVAQILCITVCHKDNIKRLVACIQSTCFRIAGRLVLGSNFII